MLQHQLCQCYLCQGGCFGCVVLLPCQGAALSSPSHLHQELQASLQGRLLCSSFFSGAKLLLGGCTQTGREGGVIICSLQQLARVRGDKGGDRKARRDSGPVGALSCVVMKTLEMQQPGGWQ